MNAQAEAPLVEVRDLTVAFSIGRAGFRKTKADVVAVDRVTFHINPGETLGLVGESGCGKTTIGRVLAGLQQPTMGEISWCGGLRGQTHRSQYRRAQIVFQNPYTSLNPRRTVGDSISDPLFVHRLLPSRSLLYDRLAELLNSVGLKADVANRYPHELSGGQRQRVAIARALAAEPELIVSDEAVSSLDVSVQAQVIELFKQIQQKTGIAYLFISHDFGVVNGVADRIAVMYLGSIVEQGDRENMLRNAAHPYTRALLEAIPRADPRLERGRVMLEVTGDIPEDLVIPSGCRFHPRCPIAIARCSYDEPSECTVSPGHAVDCHRWTEVVKMPSILGSRR